MDTLSLAEAIYYDPEYSGSEDDMTNIRAIQTAIDQRIAAARAAGYAEAVKNAAGVALSVMERLNTDYRHEIADAIRALAPATTKEPT